MTTSGSTIARRLRPALPAAALLAGTAALAQPAGGQPLWEIGALGVGLSQQAYPGADTQVHRAVVLPYLVYRGEVLRSDRETTGIRAVKTDRFELDIGVSGTLGARADEVQARRGMPRLGTLVEFGPRGRWDLGDAPGGGRWRLDLPLRGVFDLNERGAYRGLSFEPRLTWQRRSPSGWAYATSVSAILGDQRLAQTLYTVEAAQALPDRPAYAARSGLVAWRLAATATRSLSPDWRVFGYARVDSVAGAANQDSPLVRRTAGASVGVGLAWTWMRSEQRASSD